MAVNGILQSPRCSTCCRYLFNRFTPYRRSTQRTNRLTFSLRTIYIILLNLQSLQLL
ncbi:hypothetical protein CANCADRAFT_55722 [Tortispora caseinolytica NRRL Y-17796]|uniref:Uncharacterized protein n=1 Tax=Tortispora caseinolytica NRRL Y-17796 TaxID=767744 RepID=A0A1E4TJP6_9ASCO|nr:hypothetical protein CANCADRAFT_55722 [Tortispora caseinolytica NRRL Y-17796]